MTKNVCNIIFVQTSHFSADRLQEGLLLWTWRGRPAGTWSGESSICATTYSTPTRYIAVVNDTVQKCWIVFWGRFHFYSVPDAAGNLKVRHIFAGGNCSFATFSSNEVPTQIQTIEEIIVGGITMWTVTSVVSSQDVEKESDLASGDNATQHCLGRLIDKWTSECESKLWKKTKQYVDFHHFLRNQSCFVWPRMLHLSREIHRTFSSACCLNKSFLEQR